jgi:hypothetical protein
MASADPRLVLRHLLESVGDGRYAGPLNSVTSRAPRVILKSTQARAPARPPSEEKYDVPNYRSTYRTAGH